MNFIKVRNWQKFQHYHKPHPSWIKFYVELLDDPKLEALPMEQQGCLFKMWLLAARCGNSLPDDANWIAGKIGAKTVDLDAMQELGYIEDHTTQHVVATSRGSLENLYTKSIAETETEGETYLPAQKAQGAKVNRKPSCTPWGAWIDANREKGRPDPVALGKDTKASKTIFKALGEDLDLLKTVYARYLDDADQFLTKQGHALALLQARVNGYINPAATDGNSWKDIEREATDEEVAITSQPVD